MRQSEQRGINLVDDGGRCELHIASKEEDAKLEADAEWGKPVRVLGYDSITVMLDFTKGSASSVAVTAQISYRGDDEAAEWFDYYDQGTPSGVLERKYWEPEVVAATVKISWNIPTAGVYMRFKAFVEGPLTDSRIYLTGTRRMAAS